MHVSIWNSIQFGDFNNIKIHQIELNSKQKRALNFWMLIFVWNSIQFSEVRWNPLFGSIQLILVSTLILVMAATRNWELVEIFLGQSKINKVIMFY